MQEGFLFEFFSYILNISISRNTQQFIEVISKGKTQQAKDKNPSKHICKQLLSTKLLTRKAH